MFGKRLKELRLAYPMTQEELAKALNVSPSTISLYESGSREPSGSFIVTVARFFNVSSDYLLGLADSSPKPLSPQMQKKIEQFVKEAFDLYISSRHLKNLESNGEDDKV